MNSDSSDVVAKLVVAATQAADFTAGAGVERALAFIVGHLMATMPGTPVVAAESDPATFRGYEAAKSALFLARLDRSTANAPAPAGLSLMVGFAEEGRATAGVVLSTGIDGQRRIYGGAVGAGAFIIGPDGARSPIQVSSMADIAAARCAIARSHRTKNVDAKLAALGCKELAPFGGDGLKGVRVASGELLAGNPQLHAEALRRFADFDLRTGGATVT